MTETPDENDSDRPEAGDLGTPESGAGTAGGDDSRTPEGDGSEPASGDGGPLAGRRGTVARGLLVAVAVAAAIAVAAAVVPTLFVDTAPEPEFRSFDPDRTVTTGLSSAGSIEPEPPVVPAGGTVVVDAGPDSRSRLGPLAEAISAADHDVEYPAEGLADSLDGADGLVIVDPETGYSERELDAIEAFADEGGRVVIFGNPNRFEISAGVLGSSLSERESELSELGGRFDLYFDTRYVYDQERNDGNYRHVLVRPPEDASLTDGNGSIADAEDVVLYTPTEVRSTDDAEPILVTSPDARTADSDAQREHTVALRDGNVLAVGDARFIAADRYNVGDNDEFLAGVVEFLVTGDRNDATDDATGDAVAGNGSAAGGNATSGGNETETDARLAT